MNAVVENIGGMLFGRSNNKSQKAQADADKARSEDRNLRQISNDRSKAELQVDGARKGRSRGPKRGKRLFSDKRSQV